MAVQKTDKGRRLVQVEVVLPGTQEEVWEAIATAGGITSWFVPTSTEYDGDGMPVRMTSNFGPGMESVADITNWNPPESFATESKDLGEDAPSIDTEWLVEPRGSGICAVRVVHSLSASTAAWDNQLEAWESGWPSFFRLLRLYLAHFPGQSASTCQLSAITRSNRHAVWSTLTSASGLEQPELGQRCQSAESAPALAGEVHHAGDASHPEELVLVLDTPCAGIAHCFAMDMGEDVMLSLRLYLYGEEAKQVIAREEACWQTWLAQQFPAAAATSQSEG